LNNDVDEGNDDNDANTRPAILTSSKECTNNGNDANTTSK